MIDLRPLHVLGWKLKDFPLSTSKYRIESFKLRKYFCNYSSPLHEVEHVENVFKDTFTADSLDCYVLEDEPLSCKSYIYEEAPCTPRTKLVRLRLINSMKKVKK